MDLFLKMSVLQAIFRWLGDLEKIICPWKVKLLLGNRQFRMSEGIWFFGVSNSWYVLFFLRPTRQPPPPPNYPPLKGWNFPMSTTKLASMKCLDFRLLGNFPVSEVGGCRCTLLAGNSSISLAGSEEQINFSQQSPKMLKMVSESFVHALLLFLRLFLKISRWVLLHPQVKNG